VLYQGRGQRFILLYAYTVDILHSRMRVTCGKTGNNRRSVNHLNGCPVFEETSERIGDNASRAAYNRQRQ